MARLAPWLIRPWMDPTHVHRSHLCPFHRSCPSPHFLHLPAVFLLVCFTPQRLADLQIMTRLSWPSRAELAQAQMSPFQYSDEAHQDHSFQRAPAFIPSTLLSFHPFSTLKIIELLIGAGEVVYYIQQWRHHFESGRSGDKFASRASEFFDGHHA